MDYPEHEKFSHEGLTRALVSTLEMAVLGDEKDPRYGWYNGVLFAVRGLTAEQASRSLGPEGASAAAHADHALVCLEYVRHTLLGEKYEADWASSWRIKKVSEAEWEGIRAALEREYELLSELLRTKPFWRAEGLGAAINTIAHTAYHAGAVRQILKASVAA